eukprot:TRINITY_DN294_c0_g1_i1.p1 TRINITY_DN294_c0_g1~~TRINITY_DN294_c0_g1_i1.p1  ORF type:complete len:461 (+),score=62.30 TRINITY_DN294_c0_g1_i1:53-1435(+)
MLSIVCLCDELLLLVLRHLHDDDLRCVAAVCKRLHYLARDGVFWRRRFLATFPFSIDDVTSQDWFSSYYEQHKLGSNWLRRDPHPIHITGHSDRVSALQFDSSLFVSASWDHTIRVDPNFFSSNDQTLILSPQHRDRVTSVHFDASFLTSCSDDGSVMLFHRRNRFRFMAQFQHSAQLTSVYHQRHLCTVASRDGSLQILHLPTLQRLIAIRQRCAAPVLCTSLSFAAGHFVCGGEDFSLRLYDVQTARCVRVYWSHTLPVHCVLFAANSTAAADSAVCHSSGGVTVSQRRSDSADHEDGALLHRQHGPQDDMDTDQQQQQHDVLPIPIGYDPQGPPHAAVDRPVPVPSANALLESYDTSALANEDKDEDDNEVLHCGWHGAQHVLASGAWDGTVRLHDTRCEADIATLAGHRASVYALHIVGDKLLSGGGDGGVIWWDIRRYGTKTHSGHGIVVVVVVV